MSKTNKILYDYICDKYGDLGKFYEYLLSHKIFNSSEIEKMQTLLLNDDLADEIKAAIIVCENLDLVPENICESEKENPKEKQSSVSVMLKWKADNEHGIEIFDSVGEYLNNDFQKKYMMLSEIEKGEVGKFIRNLEAEMEAEDNMYD